MAEETGNEGTVTLPEGWSELPEVKGLITKSVKDAVGQKTQGLSNKNTELLAEVKKFKGIAKSVEELGDLEAAKEAIKKVQELEDKELLDTNQIDELLKKRTQRMVDDHGTQVTSLTTALETAKSEIDVYKGKLGKVTIEGGIRDAVMALEGPEVYPHAWPDIISRGKQVFSLNDKGESEPRDANGNIMYGKDASAPMTFKEWAETLADTAPHFFVAQNKGGPGGLPSNDTSRKGKTLEEQLEDAHKAGDTQLKIRLKRLIAVERASKKQ